MAAHKYLWEKLGILHGDISIGNILLRRVEGQGATGLLIDFDSAIIRAADPKVAVPVAANDDDGKTSVTNVKGRVLTVSVRLNCRKPQTDALIALNIDGERYDITSTTWRVFSVAVPMFGLYRAITCSMLYRFFGYLLTSTEIADIPSLMICAKWHPRPIVSSRTPVVHGNPTHYVLF